MGKKVPNILKKALFSYIERPENEVVEDLIKSCFPENRKHSEKSKRAGSDDGESRN